MTFRNFLPLVLISLFFFLGGCASSNIELQMNSVDHRHGFDQKFDKAYITHNDAGDADIVLVEDGIGDGSASNSDGVIQPDKSFAPRQMVHIRVYWSPLAGTKTDMRASTNANVHWVLGIESDRGTLEYAGPAVVTVDKDGNGADIRVKAAWLKVVATQGGMVDPIGTSVASGSIYAVADPGKVAELLAEMKTATVAASGNSQARVNVDP